MMCKKFENEIPEEDVVCAECEMQLQESEVDMQNDSAINTESKSQKIDDAVKTFIDKIKNIDKNDVNEIISKIRSKIKNFDFKLFISKAKIYVNNLINFKNLNDADKTDVKKKTKSIAKVISVLLALIIVINIFGAINGGGGKIESEIMNVLYDTPVAAQVSNTSIAYAIEAAFIDYEMTYSKRSDGTYSVKFSGEYAPNIDVPEAIFEGTVYITLDVESGKVFSITPENMKSTLMQYAIYM